MASAGRLLSDELVLTIRPTTPGGYGDCTSEPGSRPGGKACAGAPDRPIWKPPLPPHRTHEPQQSPRAPRPLAPLSGSAVSAAEDRGAGPATTHCQGPACGGP